MVSAIAAAVCQDMAVLRHPAEPQWKLQYTSLPCDHKKKSDRQLTFLFSIPAGAYVPQHVTRGTQRRRRGEVQLAWQDNFWYCTYTC